MRTSMLLYYFAITILSSCIAQTPVLNENNQSVQAKVIDRLKQENVTEQFNLDQTVWHQNSSSDQEKRNITRIGVKNRKIQKERQLMCDICSRKFKTTSDLKRHMIVHTNESKFKCDICGKQYRHSNSLITHHNTHTGKKFACDVCGKQYVYKINLKLHIRIIHEEKKNFECEICDKKYGYLHNLIGHRVKHTGKKFVCNVCGKQYVYKSGLQFHIKTIHKNQEILKYDMCGENYRNALLDHGNIRATKKFRCDVCNKEYRYLGNLRAHMKNIHTDKKEFKSDECNKMFKRKCSSKKHKTIKHNVLPTTNSLTMITGIPFTNILINKIIMVTRL